MKLLLAILSLFLFLSVGASSANAQTAVCEKQAPLEAPNLYQVSKSSTSATLYFVEPSSEFTGYTISYGLDAAAASYSISFNQGRLGGATSYTINDLYQGSTYYFKVRANNGCAAGPWSANISNVSTLPETGPKDLFQKSAATTAVMIAGLMILALPLRHKKQKIEF